MSLYTGPFVLIILLIKRVHVLYIYTFICKGNIYCNRICKLRYLCLNLFHTVLRFVLKSLTLNFLSVVSQWTFFLLLVNENDTNGVQDTAQQDLVHSYRSSSSACLICIETIKKTDAVSTVHLMWYILNKTIFSHMTQGPLPHTVWWNGRLGVLCRSGTAEVVMLCSTCSVSRSGSVKVYTSMPTNLQMGKPLARTFLGTGKVY